MKTSKISAEMFLQSELRKEFMSRVRSTAFMSTQDGILVSFHFFSSIVSRFPEASGRFAEVVDKAIGCIRFHTPGGSHILRDVDYMFIDPNGLCVAVLTDGRDFPLLSAPQSSESYPLKVNSPLELTVSTQMLKRYYLKHKLKFPYLNELARQLYLKRMNTAYISKHSREVADSYRANLWFQAHVLNCLQELDLLVSNASFLLSD